MKKIYLQGKRIGVYFRKMFFKIKNHGSGTYRNAKERKSDYEERNGNTPAGPVPRKF